MQLTYDGAMTVSARTQAPIIAPSILAADLSQLGVEIAKVRNADWLHVDVMDGHFVPNLSFGAGVAGAAGRVSDLPLDVHLMIEQPEDWIQEYVEAGASSIIFHVEAAAHPYALADNIRAAGCRAGFSLKPGTALVDFLPLVEHVDQVLVMTVEPGFGGQEFMPEQLDKVRALRRYIDAHGLDCLIEVDGGINAETIGAAAEAGADAFVAGSAVFGADSPAAAVDELRAKAAQR